MERTEVYEVSSLASSDVLPCFWTGIDHLGDSFIGGQEGLLVVHQLFALVLSGPHDHRIFAFTDHQRNLHHLPNELCPECVGSQLSVLQVLACR